MALIARDPAPVRSPLRLLMDRQQILPVPGGGTPLEAHCAAAAGFEAFYLSGYAIAAWRHGLPDIGLTSLSDVADAVAAITTVTDIPVLVDADTGYGDVAGVVTTVGRLEQAGAAAIQIEDQVWPKRCGHMQGKEVIPADAMERKVLAAVRSRSSDDTLIIARTDALAPLGVREAVERGKRYADAGADAIFVDAPQSLADLELIAASIDCPLVVNLTESGRTPILPLDQLGEMGFAIAIYPTAALRLAARSFMLLFDELRRAGGTGEWAAGMMTLTQLNALVGQPELESVEAAVIASAKSLR